MKRLPTRRSNSPAKEYSVCFLNKQTNNQVCEIRSLMVALVESALDVSERVGNVRSKEYSDTLNL